MQNLDSGSGTFLMLLDLSAVFDTIDYNVLCDVLPCHMGMYVTTPFYVRFFKAILNQLLLMDTI